MHSVHNVKEKSPYPEAFQPCCEARLMGRLGLTEGVLSPVHNVQTQLLVPVVRTCQVI